MMKFYLLEEILDLVEPNLEKKRRKKRKQSDTKSLRSLGNINANYFKWKTVRRSRNRTRDLLVRIYVLYRVIRVL